MRLLRFIVRRLILLSVVLAIVSVLIFGIVQVLPGDVVTMILGTEATAEDLATLRERLGLARPPGVRYLEWIGGVLRGDWGSSLLYQVPVRPLVVERLGRSTVLGGLALSITVPLALALGVLSAVHRERLVDHVIATITLVAVSLPEFVSGTVLILLLAFQFRLLPPTSMLDPDQGALGAGVSLVLPVLTLSLALLAHMTRMTRAAMLDVLDRPFIRAARLRGLRPRRVVIGHALRNALLPTVGVIALNVGFVLGGVVVVETVFAYPGLGRLLVDAITHRDVPLVQMAALVVAASCGAANMAADVAYAFLDPRIRY